MSDNETQRARASGRLAGSQHYGQARECPFPFHSPMLRRAWLEGFSEGRVQARQKPRAAFLHDADVAERVTYTMDLRCPTCGTTGSALMSEIASPQWGNIDFRIEAVPPRFRSTRQSRALGDTVIVCEACGTAAR